CRKLVVASAQRGLNIGGAAYGLDRAGKFGKNRVAGRIENPPVVHRYQRFKYLLVAAKGSQGLLFVLPHQPAEFGHIRGENCGQLAFNELRARRIVSVWHAGHSSATFADMIAPASPGWEPGPLLDFFCGVGILIRISSCLGQLAPLWLRASFT